MRSKVMPRRGTSLNDADEMNNCVATFDGFVQDGCREKIAANDADGFHARLRFAMMEKGGGVVVAAEKSSRTAVPTNPLAPVTSTRWVMFACSKVA